MEGVHYGQSRFKKNITLTLFSILELTHICDLMFHVIRMLLQHLPSSKDLPSIVRSSCVLCNYLSI